MTGRENCTTHKPYRTREEAEADMKALRRKVKGQGRRLNVFACGANRVVPFDHFHVGRAKQYSPERKTTEQSKPLTPGQARREAARAQKEAERHGQRAKLFSEYAENLEWVRTETERLWAQLGRT